MRRCDILMTSYMLILCCFTCFSVLQCFVPTIAMYYRKSFGLNKMKNMFLERKSKNATVWHTQHFKMGSVLGGRDKWPKSKYQNFKSTQWFSYKIWTKNSEKPIFYLHRIRHEYKREKKKNQSHTVALGIDLRRSSHREVW